MEQTADSLKPANPFLEITFSWLSKNKEDWRGFRFKVFKADATDLEGMTHKATEDYVRHPFVQHYLKENFDEDVGFHGGFWEASSQTLNCDSIGSCQYVLLVMKDSWDPDDSQTAYTT